MQARLLEPRTGLYLPDGLIYEDGLITEAEEAALLDAIRHIEFQDIIMHGVVARRRSVHYGWKYDYASWQVHEAPEIPAFLLPLRRRAAELTGQPEEAFAEALINQYAPGAAIGWHRDSPAFGIVIGVSLGGECELRLRREGDSARDWVRLSLAPRGAYVLSGAARHVWQHSIPPVDALRYSVTFRTMADGHEAAHDPSPISWRPFGNGPGNAASGSSGLQVYRPRHRLRSDATEIASPRLSSIFA